MRKENLFALKKSLMKTDVTANTIAMDVAQNYFLYLEKYANTILGIRIMNLL